MMEETFFIFHNRFPFLYVMSEILSAHLGAQYISEAEQSHKTSELYKELGSKPNPIAFADQPKKDEPTNFFDIQDKERRRQYARELAGKTFTKSNLTLNRNFNFVSFTGMSAFDRHRKFLEDYVKYYGGQKWTGQQITPKTDLDILREEYRFVDYQILMFFSNFETKYQQNFDWQVYSYTRR
jgi:hypothetical protein